MTQPVDHLLALAAAQDAFAGLLAEADPEAAVPGCAPWTVADLALHLGGVHWWASAMALGVDLDPREPSEPRTSEALLAFYAWSAQALRRTLTDVPPDALALTLDGPGPAGFWRRRQLHETLVHLEDLASAVPGARVDPSGAGPEVWADAVDEVVTVMLPRQVRLRRMPALPAGIGLVAQDAGRSWVLGPAGGLPAVTVRATARELALVLWRRVPVGTLADGTASITGSREVLDRALAERLTP